MFTFTYNTRVYYKDVDRLDIMYYSRYLELFEAARTEMLRTLDLDVRMIETRGYHLPVVSCQCDFHQGARFDDQLEILTVIPTLPRLKLRIDYTVRRSRDSSLLTTGNTVHVFTRSGGKPVRIPAFVLNLLEPHFRV